TVKIWDATPNREALAIKAHQAPAALVTGVAFSPDGGRLASSGGAWTRGGRERGEPGEVKGWDARARQLLLTPAGPAAPVMSVAFSPDGGRLASGSMDRTVKVWDAHTGQELLTIKGYDAEVLAVAFSPDGEQIAVGSGGPYRPSQAGEVKVWEASTGR